MQVRCIIHVCSLAEPEGLYTLEVFLGNKSYSLSQPFTIAAYHKGRVYMDISLDKDTYNEGDTALITVRTSLLDGSLQETGKMTITATINHSQYNIVISNVSCNV